MLALTFETKRTFKILREQEEKKKKAVPFVTEVCDRAEAGSVKLTHLFG